MSTGPTTRCSLRFCPGSCRCPAQGEPATLHRHHSQRARMSRRNRIFHLDLSELARRFRSQSHRGLRGFSLPHDLRSAHYTHTTWTAVPGPVAGWAWTVANLDFALKVVPPQKLALGIPLYGYHWFSGTPTKSADKSGDKANPTAMTTFPPTTRSTSPEPTVVVSNGTPSTAPRGSIFIATTCASGFSYTGRAHVPRALRARQRSPPARASLPGFSAPKTRSIWDLLPVHK